MADATSILLANIVTECDIKEYCYTLDDIKKISNSKDLEITISEEVITTNSFSYYPIEKYKKENATDVSGLKDLELVDTFQIPLNEVNTLVDMAKIVPAKSIDKAYICGINFDADKAIASDSHRLEINKIEGMHYESTLTVKPDIFTAMKSVKLLKGSEINVYKLISNKSKFTFVSTLNIEYHYFTNLVSEKFADWKSLLSLRKECSIKIKMNIVPFIREYLYNLTSKKIDQLKLKIDKDILTISDIDGSNIFEKKIELVDNNIPDNYIAYFKVDYFENFIDGISDGILFINPASQIIFTKPIKGLCRIKPIFYANKKTMKLLVPRKINFLE